MMTGEKMRKMNGHGGVIEDVIFHYLGRRPDFFMMKKKNAPDEDRKPSL